MKKLFFLQITDKIPVENNGCCPPHYLPHKLPIGEPIIDESCHTHTACWRRWHHNLFCRVLKCPNYPTMKKYLKKP